MGNCSTFVELLLARGANQADRNGYVILGGRGADEISVTYGELDRAARVLAQVMLQHCCAGDRVLLVLQPGLAYIQAFYACLYAGVVAVPSYPPSRAGAGRGLSQLLRVSCDAQVSAVLTSSDLSGSLRGQFDAAGLCVPFILEVDVLGACEVDAEWRPCVPSAQDLAFLQYTSGSTGDPKGVMVTHGNLMANSKTICSRFSHTEHSVGVIWLPPYHDMGLIGGILQPLFAGFPTVLMPPASFVKSPLLWLRTISRFKATTSGGPDFAYAQCVREVAREDLSSLDLSSWCVAFTGAEPIRSETMRQFANQFSVCGFDANAFYPCYGLAESTLFVTGGLVGGGYVDLSVSRVHLSQHCVKEGLEDDAVSVVACGEVAQQGASLRLVDCADLSVLPENHVGEIWLAGDSVARGYWNKPDATQAVFNAYLSNGEGPYCRTGDLGFTRDGLLYVTGREKDLIIVRGRNYHPTDIETTLRQASFLFEQAGAITAFAQNEALVVLCEVSKVAAARCAVMFERAVQAVAAHHGLRVLELVVVKLRSLPKTSSGKLRRYVCQQQYELGTLEVLNRADVGGDVQALQDWMLGSVSEVLGKSPLRVDADTEFFHLGLDSMDLVRFSAALEKHLNRPVETALFFDYPTVRRLAEYLSGAVVPPSQPAVREENSLCSPELGIFGVSCRFPGADGAPAFWDLLSQGRHAIGRVPADRWNADAVQGALLAVSPWGGFIGDVAQFDAGFFGISPREAACIDPQHRVLLELAFDAMQHAGISPHRLKGSKTGVFVGISSGDYALLQTDTQQMGPYSGLGNAHSVAANRISYAFDFRGPSVAVDTACSSSLVALHLACRAIASGDCDLALVGGVNLMLTPHLHAVFSQAKMLAPDGLCKAFDDRADGYVRGEGAGFLLLGRVSEASRLGLRVLAHVLGSAVNQDGRTNGLTAPSARAQEAVIRDALAQAKVQPSEVVYVEAHGTGTPLGDPIEMRALQAVYGEGQREQALLVGSVKSNIGHLESAAGIASVIKMVLALQNEQLPASLHFTRLNHEVERLGVSLVQVCHQAWPWHVPSEQRVVGVSSFGFGGTNCHLLLRGVPTYFVVESGSGVSVLTLSAQSEWSMRTVLMRYADLLDTNPLLDLNVLARETNKSRADLHFRWAAPALSREVLCQRLRAAAQNVSDVGIAKPSKPKLLFAFSGQGAQQVGMGAVLYARFAVFRQTLDRCEELLQPHWGELKLSAVLQGEALGRTEFAQAALFSFQYALFELWRSWGVVPDAVIGHSLGEYAAACAAGVLRWEDALEMLVVRGRLMQGVRQDGRMLVVGADEDRVRGLIDETRAVLEVAAVNAPNSVVVAGRGSEIDRLEQLCQAELIRCHVLQTEQAFHSADLDPILDELDASFSRFSHAEPRIPVYGNLRGERMDSSQDFCSAYWRQHSRQPVQFSKGLNAAVRDGCAVLLEIGPDSTLSTLAAMAHGQRDVRPIASARSGVDPLLAFNEAIAVLYTEGVAVDWSLVHGAHATTISLPNYPFDRARHWIDEPERAYAMKEEAQNSKAGPVDVLANTAMEIRQLIASLLAVDEAKVNCDAPFVEIGADSLMLMSAIQAVQDKYGVMLTVNQLFEETPTINALAAWIAPQRREITKLAPSPAVVVQTAVGVDSLAERVLAGQLDVMSQQLKLLGTLKAAPDIRVEEKPHTWGESQASASQQGLPTWACQPTLVSDSTAPQLKQYVDRCIEAYVERTKTSKSLAQQYRPVLADNRACAGFRLSMKEAVYPIVGKRSQGARMWDVDDNEYIDFTMGFGANLFGHSPRFIVDELKNQIEEGFQLGPQSELAGVVASGIAELTGHERVAFCNSGSEAVMTAVRLARTVTQRSKIAIFSGSYHGTFDGVLARARVINGELSTSPVAPGTPLSFVEQEVMVLEYGSEESLRLLGENAQFLAAVIVEPVQSRHPANQPKRFLEEIRTLTQACGCAMIWDETITGFRIAPGGAQAYFGIQGDIATYGKIIGGGMPIGVVAGKARFLNAIDGGVWRYGDDSYPKAEQTFFAGTFNKHPLTLRTANAVLTHLRNAGPELQNDLNQKTAVLAQALNSFFDEESIPIRIEHFSSLFRFAFSGNMDLLFMLLMHRGIYIWEGRNCFVSTAHTENDLRHFVEQVKHVVLALRGNGFFSDASSAWLPLSDSQRRFNRWSNCVGQEAVSHIAFAMRLTGQGFDAPRLEKAFNAVVSRHDVLRVGVDSVACIQKVHERASLKITSQDFSSLDNASRQAALTAWKSNEFKTQFDLLSPPLMRVAVAKVGADAFVLHLTVHHTVCDGLALAQILDEVNRLYRGESVEQLPPSVALPDLLKAEQDLTPSAEASQYWRKQVELPPRLFNLSSPQGGPDSQGERVQMTLPASVVLAIKAKAKSHQCTPFMLLCALYFKLLAAQTQQPDVLIGIPFLNGTPKLGEAKVGCFVGIMPLRAHIGEHDEIKHIALKVRELMLTGYQHARGVCSVAEALPRVTFNFEPAILPETFGALRVNFEEVCPQQIEFDVMFNVTETPNALILNLDCRNRALNRDQALGWLAQFGAMIETLCEKEDDPLDCVNNE